MGNIIFRFSRKYHKLIQSNHCPASNQIYSHSVVKITYYLPLSDLSCFTCIKGFSLFCTIKTWVSGYPVKECLSLQMHNTGRTGCTVLIKSLEVFKGATSLQQKSIHKFSTLIFVTSIVTVYCHAGIFFIRTNNCDVSCWYWFNH